jgi:hypothetical protein
MPRPVQHHTEPFFEEIIATVSASASLPIACASAISATSREEVVVSLAESRKVERKPCTEMLVRPRGYQDTTPAMWLSAAPRPGKTHSSTRTALIVLSTARAASDNGTRCSLLVFIRRGGIAARGSAAT